MKTVRTVQYHRELILLANGFKKQKDGTFTKASSAGEGHQWVLDIDKGTATRIDKYGREQSVLTIQYHLFKEQP